MARTVSTELVCHVDITARFPPAILISQKSKIFDSFLPGEAFGRCRKCRKIPSRKSGGVVVGSGDGQLHAVDIDSRNFININNTIENDFTQNIGTNTIDLAVCHIYGIIHCIG